MVLLGGSCLMILAMSTSGSTLHRTSAAESTNLASLPGSLRSTMKASPVLPQTMTHQLPHSSPWKLALGGIEASNRPRDVSMNANRFNPLGLRTIKTSKSNRDNARVTEPIVTMFGQGEFDNEFGLRFKQRDNAQLIQNRELLNGRLAMVGIAGILAQEFVSGAKVDIPALFDGWFRF